VRDGRARAGRARHVGARLGSGPDPFDVARDAGPDVPPFGAGGALPLAKSAETDALERHLESRRVIAAVVARGAAVLKCESHVPRKFMRLDEVATPDLARLEAQLAGDPADDALHDEGAVPPPGAAVGRDHDLVRVADLELDVVVAEPVWPGKLRRSDQRNDDAVRRVRAGVVQKAVAQAKDAAGLVGRHLDLVQLAALLARAGEVLRAVLDP